jgi:hypothetical protein
MFAASLAAVLVMAAPVPKGPAGSEPAEAVRARAKAVAWLSDQAKDGWWSGDALKVLVAPAGMEDGMNSLATAALLEAGVRPTAAPVRDALARLGDAKTGFTYSVALQTVALAKADPEKYAAKL